MINLQDRPNKARRILQKALDLRFAIKQGTDLVMNGVGFSLIEKYDVKNVQYLYCDVDDIMQMYTIYGMYISNFLTYRKIIVKFNIPYAYVDEPNTWFTYLTLKRSVK